ncbi:MAG: hypothetical protein JJU28_11680 [Cyclobacteriaceae bacterium]|nr:hypothetical protein [Cyclobacteriaceae bacterium]
MKTIRKIRGILLLCALFASCKTNVLVLEDMLPSARLHDFDVSFEQSSFSQFSLKLMAQFEVRNPYNKALPIPDHAMGILVNQKNLGMFTQHKSVTIPAKSSLILTYPFNIGSNTLQQLMGKENRLTLLSDIELDLSGYSNMLPNYQLRVSDNFNLESDELKNLAGNLAKKKIGKYKVHLEHSATLKVPTAPVITKSTLPAEIRLLGTGLQLLNPNQIKNALIPFGDLLINGELDGLKDPFVDALVNATVIYPDPTPLEWFRTREVRIELQILGMLRPLDATIDSKWSQTKSLLYRSARVPLADYMIDNFITTYVDPQAGNKWNSFQNAYNQLKNTVFPDQIPGPNTRGFELAIPVIFKNQNEFSVNIPVFRASTFFNNAQPFSLYIRPANVSEIPLNQIPSKSAEIGGKSEQVLYIVFSFDMNGFQQGMYSLFMKQQFEPNLKGIMGYDFGYGPMYISYDLQSMGMQFK